MFDMLSAVDWAQVIAVVATVALGVVSVKYRKYLHYFRVLAGLAQELSEALEPDKDGRIRTTKHEIRRIVLQVGSFLE